MQLINPSEELKIDKLLLEKEEELAVTVIDTAFDSRGNFHVLCNRSIDNSYIVWTSIVGYDNFYNGKYDMCFDEGKKELKRRKERNKIISNKKSTELSR